MEVSQIKAVMSGVDDMYFNVVVDLALVLRPIAH